MNSEKVKRFKPHLDKLFWWILIVASVIMLPLTLLTAWSSSPFLLLFTVPIDLLVAYFIVSPLFGYAELREESLFIKFGVFLKREIPYTKIRGTQKERKFYSDSMLALKNSLEHVNVKYNKFDMLSISVKDNDAFIEELQNRIK